jgi:hypothetical protein
MIDAGGWECAEGVRSTSSPAISMLPAIAARCRGVSPHFDRTLASAPRLSSVSTRSYLA